MWAKITARTPDLTKGIAGYFLRAVSVLPTSISPKDFNKPNQPMVEVNGKQARQICETQGKRLLTPIEWEYVASQGGTKQYSTRSGKLDSGVHYNAEATRQVCEAVGHYIEFGGREICDMNGNVWEWTLDSSGDYYISGGSWHDDGSWYLQADYRDKDDPGFSNVNVGFRCGSSAQHSLSGVKSFKPESQFLRKLRACSAGCRCRACLRGVQINHPGHSHIAKDRRSQCPTCRS